MTVIHLDSCHLCDRPIHGGVFCGACLLYAAETVSKLRHPSSTSATPASGSSRHADPPLRVVELQPEVGVGAVGRPAVSSGKTSGRVRGSGSARPTAPTSSGGAA